MYGRFVAHGSWAFSAPSRSSLWIMRVAAGRVAITAGSDGSMVRAEAGDYVVMRDGETFTMAAGSATAVEAWPPASSAGGDGPVTDLRAMAIGAPPPRTARHGPGLLRLDADPGTAAALDATFGLLEHERDRAEPGADLVTSRLGDVLATHALRAIAATTAARPAALLTLMDDPRIGRAARAMHDDLAHPWTVASLAREAHMSRAAFAAAFREAAGESPVGLLRRWRLCQAKRLLRETTMTLTEIALQVGYESAPALSRAFGRQEQMTPGRWRSLAVSPAGSATSYCR